MRVVLLLALGACFSPSAPSGVPCAAEQSGGARCPTDQVCIEENCRPKGFGSRDDGGTDDALADARVDGPPGDNDADGVPDMQDDCPDDPDPGQYNEDGDKFGDACDPCPPVADDTPADADMDGVQDECDPNPATPGDSLRLFEGFNAGIPAGWRSGGPLTLAAGVIVATVGDLEDAWVGPPTLVDRRSTVTIGMTITAFEDGANGAGAAHALGVEATACTLFVDGDTKGYGLIDLDTDTIENGNDFNWTTNGTYSIAHTRRDQNSTCTIVGPTGTKMSLGATNDLGTANVNIEAFTRGFTTKFAWLMYVDSP